MTREIEAAAREAVEYWQDAHELHELSGHYYNGMDIRYQAAVAAELHRVDYSAVLAECVKVLGPGVGGYTPAE